MTKPLRFILGGLCAVALIVSSCRKGDDTAADDKQAASPAAPEVSGPAPSSGATELPQGKASARPEPESSLPGARPSKFELSQATELKPAGKAVPRWTPGPDSTAGAPRLDPPKAAAVASEPKKGREGAGPLPNPLRDGDEPSRFEMTPWSPPVADQFASPSPTRAKTAPAGSGGQTDRGKFNIVRSAEPEGGPPTAKTESDGPSAAKTARDDLPGKVAQAATAPAAALQGPVLSVPGPSSTGTGAAKSETPATDKPGQAPFDPIKENGPIFVDWPKPKLALVLTGRMDGYMEPCGCAGLDRMKGGLMRRHSFLKQLAERGWPVIALDVGGLAKGFGRQPQMKFHYTVEALKLMGYHAIGFGPIDLQLPAADLVSDVAGSPQQPSPFLCANVGLFGLKSAITERKRILAAGGIKVGVTAILGKSYKQEINNPDIEIIPPEEAIGKVLPDLKKECNLLVLLAHATMAETTALAQKFPDFDVVVTAGGASEPPNAANATPGSKTLLIVVGEKGMNAIVLGLFENPRQVFRYQRVPLDSRFAPSPQVKQIMRNYQMDLKLQGFAGLGIRAMPHPSRETLGRFAGSEKCKDCHEESYRIWKRTFTAPSGTAKTGHVKAYTTLTDLDPARQFDPECLSCHVMGWHPSQFFPYQGGYESFEKTPHLANVGCESCHGPGEAHCKAEKGGNLQLQERLQKAMRVTKADAKKHLCLTCHDGDNSPDFNFDTYWPKVEHKEDGKAKNPEKK